MRSAIIGVRHPEDTDLRRRFTKASTVITHSDPKAAFGAHAVADLAAAVTRHGKQLPVLELGRILEQAGEGDEWHEIVHRTINACVSGKIEDAVTASGRKHGVSGYILHTLPVAVAAWHIHFGNFRKTIETIAALGGDTDTVGAIAGSLAGISCTRDGIPDDWLAGMADLPHSVAYLSQLAGQLAAGQAAHTGFSWLLFPRGLFFTVFVLLHGLRRLLPPY
jgi:ADP-ribosylglycohydrolase